MAFNPEAAYAALFTRLQQAAKPAGTVFQTATRILQSWDDKPPAFCPALMLSSGPMTPIAAEKVGFPPLWKVDCIARLYCWNQGDPLFVPTIQLNTIIAAVVNLLQMQAGETVNPTTPFVGRPPGQYNTTLGGLAAWVRVGGPIEVYEGLADNGGAAAAYIPIEMMLTS